MRLSFFSFFVLGLGFLGHAFSVGAPMDLEPDYPKIVEEQNPQAALAVLTEQLKLHPELENTCHSITHEIGHAAYEKYGFQKALTAFEDDLCGSGYMHGVTEEYIEQSQDPLHDILTACPPSYGACFHGIGHGLLLYYENEIPQALAGCDLFDSVQQKVQCSEGVFMQSYNTDTTVHPNAYLNPEDTLFPCDQQTDLYKSACYFYSPRYFIKLHPRAYLEDIQVCLQAETDYIGQCIRGVGSVTMKQNIDDVSFVESVCLSAPDDYQAACYGGMTSYFVIHSGSLAEAGELCPQLDGDFEGTCEATVSASAGFFGD